MLLLKAQFYDLFVGCFDSILDKEVQAINRAIRSSEWHPNTDEDESFEYVLVQILRPVI